MITNKAEYENIDDKSQPPNESIHTNPVFDDHDEVKLFFLNLYPLYFNDICRIIQNYPY